MVLSKGHKPNCQEGGKQRKDRNKVKYGSKKCSKQKSIPRKQQKVTNMVTGQKYVKRSTLKLLY